MSDPYASGKWGGGRPVLDGRTAMKGRVVAVLTRVMDSDRRVPALTEDSSAAHPVGRRSPGPVTPRLNWPSARVASLVAPSKYLHLLLVATP